MNNRSTLARRIAVAAGRQPADLLLRNCQVVNVFTEEVLHGDIAIVDGTVAAIGKPGEYVGQAEVDANGSYAVPGLIDAHMHLESTMVRPSQFATAAVPHGTTGIIADPHEIANVCGADGIRFILNDTADLPLDVFVMVPSCVPATDFETSGARLLASDIQPLMSEPRVRGLGEVMSYPGVIAGDSQILDKLLCVDRARGQVADGHSPWVTGTDLNAYVAAGICTDHECSNAQQMLERLRLGMYVQLREGSACHDLDALLAGYDSRYSHRLLRCTDDKHPEDIARSGHIDNNVRKAVANGVNPLQVIRMASLNVAECYALRDRGAIAPGYVADILLVDDLADFRVRAVYKSGALVAKDGQALFSANTFVDSCVYDSVHVAPLASDDLRIALTTPRVKVIGLKPHSVETDALVEEVGEKEGAFAFDPALDILKLAVVERHHASGKVGLGLLKGYGLRGGAIASTVAHDSHNIIVVGSNDEDMLAAVDELRRVQGGITVVTDGVVQATLPLPIAGLMSDESVIEVEARVNVMKRLAYDRGVNPDIEPFMTLSFLALPVIPALKLTDQGLFDVRKFAFTGIEAD
jgi:adenine deaminase